MNFKERLFQVGMELESLYALALPFEDNRDLVIALAAVKRILDRREGLGVLHEEMKLLTR